jgi:hypothetical protein
VSGDLAKVRQLVSGRAKKFRRVETKGTLGTEKILQG